MVIPREPGRLLSCSAMVVVWYWAVEREDIGELFSIWRNTMGNVRGTAKCG